MYQPEAYAIALLFMIGSMLCWGSWANTMKLTPGWAFQLFYWDYVIGIIAASLVWGLTLGSIGGGELSFLTNIGSADATHIIFALLGGAVFNVANLLLVAAIDIAGLAVAFPIGIGLALVVGVLLNYFISPQGSPLLLFGGVLLVVLAIVVDALAYRRRETTQKTLSARGIQISLACGVLMGVFYPLVAKAITGNHSLGPYSGRVFLCLGYGGVCSAGELLFDAEAANRRRAGRHGRLHERACRVAWVGNSRRNDLVYGSGIELRGFPRTHHRSGCFVRDRPGRHDDFRNLGSLCVEGICQCTSGCAKADTTDVPVFPRRVGRSRGGAGVSAVTKAATA